MTASESTTENAATLPDRVAAAALAHPSVVRLDRGETGTVASHLPGRQVVGVRIPATSQPATGQPVEVAVVLRLDRPLPEIVTELRERVRSVTGAVPVDITVSDVVVER